MKIQQKKKKQKGPSPAKLGILFLAAVFLTGTVLFLFGGGSKNEEDVISEYQPTYQQLTEYVTKTQNDIGDIGYTTPLLANHNFYYKDSSYTEQEYLNAIALFNKIYQPLIDNLQYYDAENDAIIYQVQANEDIPTANEDTTIKQTLQDFNIIEKETEIKPQEEAMLFELILEMPLYENGSKTISNKLKNNVNLIIFKYSSQEEYNKMVELIETTGYVNIYNDSEAGFNIPKLNAGSIEIKEGDIASSSEGNSYPSTNSTSTGNLRVCYEVSEDGNYAFQRAKDAKESIFGVYDDYSDCIKGKYQLSLVPRLGYAKTSVNTNSAANGEVTKNELYEVAPVKKGQYVEASGVKVQKLSDNKVLSDE